MLYGNLIFIKKTGGDGSKFPVTEKDIKIGRSEDCLIRIYNSQVAPEHCRLIIKDNGQTKLRNLSDETLLNGKPLGKGDVTLCHGDIFKVGERLARWEYLPASKYYRQLLSPTGRLVAVVVPQQRSSEEEAISRSSQVSVLKNSKNTPLGKRRHSERGSSASSAVKVRKSSGTDLTLTPRGDLPKFISHRLSLKTTKFLLHGGKVKERKSVSGIVSSKTYKGGKTRKSMLPSWKANFVSPPKGKTNSRNSLTKSSEKSTMSPKNAVKTPVKGISGVSSKNSLSLVVESPSSKGRKGSVRSARSFGKSPSPKKTSPKSPSKVVSSTPKPKPPVKLARMVHSESKPSSETGKQVEFPKETERMSLILERADYVLGRSFKNFFQSVSQEKGEVSERVVSDSVVESPVSRILLNEISPDKEKETVNGTTAVKTPGKNVKPTKKSLLQKTLQSPAEIVVKTPRKSVIVQTPGNLTQKRSRGSTSGEVDSEVIVKIPPAMDLNSMPCSKKAKYTLRKSTKSTPIKKTTGEVVSSAGKIKLSTLRGRKISISQNETISLAPESAQRSASPTGRKSAVKEAPLKKKENSPRGVRRKLSPSSSAERAAKKLKTSSPKKPDKNKKAALLVLGKANRRQLLSQNVKVLLKQKIVKKAIKQSTALTSQKVEGRTKAEVKLKKALRKTAMKSKKKPVGKEKSPDKITSSKSSGTSDATTYPTEEKMQEVTPKSKTLLETGPPSVLKTPASTNLFSKGKPSKQSKISESPFSMTSFNSFTSTSSPSDRFDTTAESYLFNSNRRSKRLSSKNETGRPDFIELSPTALGLMPKNANIFKTPKESKRRNSSLVTPKSVRSVGIIKSASTSKIVNRKSVRFSSKDVSYNSESQSPIATEKVDFDFSSYQTPDVTVDMFVSPLTDKNSVAKKEKSDTKNTEAGNISKTSSTKARRSRVGPKSCVRKLLQSPQVENLDKISYVQKSVGPNSATRSQSPGKLEKELKVLLGNKSPKNDLSDLIGVRQLFLTPKAQNSPKNDLTDVKGIKKLFQTPKTQKSPKNDLVDVRGVKRLLQTPKTQKSPKNDLTDVRGVKKLLQTPKVQKSPKNDLTDVQGVKKLLQTPKVQKSPKNDLTDVQGVKKLLQTPKVQKSPKNDLTDVQGVKKLMRTPKAQRSPKNDLTKVDGVKELLRSPRVQKGPKNDLSDLRGVKKLLGSPNVQRSPKNDLTDVTGVKKLFTTPRDQTSPKNNSQEMMGEASLLDSPEFLKLSRYSTADVMRVFVNSPKSERNVSASAADVTKVNQILISKSPEGVSKRKNTVSRNSHENDFRAIRGRRSIYSTPKGPKNDLSDLRGVRELFSRHKPTSDYNISLTGVPELFYLRDDGVPSKAKKGKPRKSMEPARGEKSLSKRTLNSAKKLKEKEGQVQDRPLTRRGILNKATAEEAVKRTSRRTAAVKVEVKKPAKRKVVEKRNTSQAKKTSGVAEESKKTTKRKTKTIGKMGAESESAEGAKEEVQRSRKRKVVIGEVETPPTKSRRKLAATEETTSSVVVGTSRRAVSRSKKRTSLTEETLKDVKKDSAKARSAKNSRTSSKVESKTAVKTSTEGVRKVQSRSQSSSKTDSSQSEGKGSLRKTRIAKGRVSKTVKRNVSKAQSKPVGKKVVKAAAGRSKTSPVVKRSTRRK